MRHLSKTGSGLIEAIVAGMIFIISVSGIFATLAATRKTVDLQAKEAIAAMYTKSIFEDLRTKVDARSYDHDSDTYFNLLSEGNHTLPDTTFDNVLFKGYYKVTTEPTSHARQIQMFLTF